MEFVTIGILALLGAVFGSFAGAQVWRIRTKEHESGELEAEEVSDVEHKKISVLSQAAKGHDRSRCLECGQQLAWYDLLPVVSWLWLRGTCRYCLKPIGYTEFLLEVGLAVVFGLSYILWPFSLASVAEVTLFGLWLMGLVLATVLFMYDLKWFILPDRINYAYAAVGCIFAALSLWLGFVDSFWLIAASVAVMSGIYLVLYLISGGAWIGFGDVKLGLGLGVFLLDWKLALVALFLANLIGTVVIVPLLATKKITRKAVIPFGPFLIVGTLVAFLIGRQLIELYLSVLF